MKFRSRRIEEEPKLVIIPMIDIMFFLLVFFMISTIYMINLHTIPVHLPVASTSVANDVPEVLSITVKKNGSIYLNDTAEPAKAAVAMTQKAYRANPDLSVIVRADDGVNYGVVIRLIDDLRKAGVDHFALSVDQKD